jgi:hypothetical protein
METPALLASAAFGGMTKIGLLLFVLFGKGKKGR